MKSDNAALQPASAVSGDKQAGRQRKRNDVNVSGMAESSNGTKTVVKKKVVTVTKVNGVKEKKEREKKVFSLPGQRYDAPEERDPLRIFYESLYEQIPTSDMAEIWLMEHGLLSPKDAQKALEKKQGRPKQGTPVKPSASSRGNNKGKADPDSDFEAKPKAAGVANGGKAKAVAQGKRKKNVSDSDDDFIAIKKTKRRSD